MGGRRQENFWMPRCYSYEGQLWQPGPKLAEVSVVQSPALVCTEGVTSMDQNIANNANFMHSIGSCDNLVTLPNLLNSSTVQALMKGHTVQIRDGSTVSGESE